MLDLLESIGAIKNVEPDYIMHTTVPVSTPELDERELQERALTSQVEAPWGLGRISHKAKGQNVYVYDNSAGSGTTIYVIDTGVSTGHVEFTGRARIGANFVSGESSADGNGHGTHCAGTAASRKYGVAKNANIVGVKVLGADGSGSNSQVLAGINWAVNDAKNNNRLSKSVISMSLGGGYSQQSNDAVAQAVRAGVFVAVAAGNEGENAANSSPASEPSVCTVGASDINDTFAYFSNYGSLVDIIAPGVNVLSTWIGSNTATNTISGTSMATPHIAGLAAYLIALEGARSPAALCSRIQALSGKNYLSSVPSGTKNQIVSSQPSQHMCLESSSLTSSQAYNGNGY